MSEPVITAAVPSAAQIEALKAQAENACNGLIFRDICLPTNPEEDN
jgi:hypothetical protein